MQYLLEHGADIDSINGMNCTPFFAAVGAKQRQIAEVREVTLSDVAAKSDNAVVNSPQNTQIIIIIGITSVKEWYRRSLLLFTFCFISS